MHRHVRRVGDKRAVVRENGAGKIEPLLDVHRIGGVLQRHAHLLGDRHEEIVEHLQHHRIGVRADGVNALELLGAGEHEVILGRQFGLPAWLDHDGLVRLDDDGGAFDAGSGLELVARVDAGLVPVAAGKELRLQGRFGQCGARPPGGLLGEFGAAADGLDRYGLDDDLLCRDR